LTGALPVALGWGTTHYGGQEVSNLRAVALPVWTNKDCDEAYFQPITDIFLCAGFAEGGRDACQGDSGTFFDVTAFMIYCGGYAVFAKYFTGNR